MNHYILDLHGYTAEEAEAIGQNTSFWCVTYEEQGDGRVLITTSYEFTPEFLQSKGIPADCVKRYNSMEEE